MPSGQGVIFSVTMSGTSSRTGVVGPRSIDDTENFRDNYRILKLKLTSETADVLGKQVWIFFDTMENSNW